MNDPNLIQERALRARVFLQQDFWNDLCEYMKGLVAERSKFVRDIKYADPNLRLSALARWQITEEVINLILQYPEAAVEAGAEVARSQQPAVSQY